MHLRITALAASVFLFNLVGCGVDDVTITDSVTTRSDPSFAAALAARAVTSGVQTLTTDEGDSESFEITNLCLADTSDDITVTWQMDDADCGNGVGVPVVGTILTTQLIAADCDGGGVPDDFAPNWGTGPGQVDPANVRDVTCVWGQDGTPAITRVTAEQGPAASQFVAFTVTVNNVRPIPNLGNDGAVNEGVPATFNGTVFDPGTEADEIAWAIWYFGDDSNTEFPNSKIADCSTSSDPLCSQSPQSELHTYIENGPYTAWLRVCDHTVPAGQTPGDYSDFDTYIAAHPFDADPLNVPTGCRDDSTSITIGNATPLVTAPTVPLTVQEGQLFNIVGSYTDAGADTHDIQWTFGTQGSHDDDTPFDYTDAETTNAGSVSRPNFELGPGSSVPTAPGYAGSGDMMNFMYHFCNSTGAAQQQTIALTVRDDDGNEGSDGRIITVVDAVPSVAWPGAVPTVNDEHSGGATGWVSAPTMTDAVPAGTITEGSYVNFTITSSTTAGFGCDDVDPTTYRWNCGAAGAEIGGLGSCNGSDTCTCLFQTGAPGGTLSTVSVTVQDDDGSQATPATLDVTVMNVRPANLTAASPINVDEGTNVIFTGATFEDPGFDSFISEWNWGDGTGTSNQLAFTPTGSNVLLYTVNDSTPPHAYQSVGDGVVSTYNAILTVRDEDTGAPLPSTTVVVNVTDVSPTVTNVVMRDAGTGTDLGTATTIDENDAAATIQLDVTATPGGVDNLTLDPIAQYTIVWGDSSPNTVRTSDQPNETFVHDYVDDSGAGSFPITITVQDSDGSTHTYGTTFQVTVDNLDPVLDNDSVVMVGTRTTASQFPALSGDTVTAVEGENLTFDAVYTEQATVDTHTYTWDFTPPAGGTGGTLTGAVSVPGTVDQGAFTFDEQGTWTVTLTVDDDDGGSDSYSFTVIVSDVHPVLAVALTQAPADRWEAQPVTVEITTTSGILPLANAAMDPVPRGTAPYAQIDCDYPGAGLTGSETSIDLDANFAPELDITDNAFPNTDCDIYDDSGDFWIAVKVYDEDSFTIVVLDENTTTPEPEPVVIRNVIPTPAVEVDSSMTTPEMTTVADLPLIVGGAFDDPGNETYWNAWWTYIDPLTGLEVRVNIDDGGTDLTTTYPTFGQLPGVKPERFLDDEASATGTAVFCGVLWVQDDDMVNVAGGSDNNAVSFPDVGTWGSRPGPTGYPTPDIATQKCTGFTFNITNEDPSFTDVEIIPPQVGEGDSITARVLDGVAVGATDIAGVNDPLTYTYYWEWGGVANPGPFTVTSSPLASNIYTLAGTYTLRVLVEDDDTGSFFIDKTIDVINIPPEIVEILQTGPKMETEEISVAPLLRSYDVGALTYGYDWNDPEDGHPDNPAVSGDLFEAGGPVGTHFYSQDGVYNVTVEVCDDFPTCVQQTIQVQITNMAPVVSILPPAAVEEGSTGARMVVEAFDISVLDEQAFTFRVDWADGAGLQAATYVPFPVSDPSAGRYVFDFAGSYADNAVLTLRAEVNDGTGATLASTAFTVTNANPVIGAITPAAPTLNEGASVTLNIPVTDPGADTFTYAVDWNGDGTFDSSSTTGTLVYTYMDNAVGGVPFDAVVRVTDDDGGVDTATHQILVNNVTPTLAVNGPTSSVIRGSSVTIECVATEPGADTLTYEWDWTYDNVTFNTEATSTTTSKSASRSRVYPTTGSFTAACRVTDDDGATSAIVTRTVVVTAPEANLLVDATSPINEEGSTVLTIETASAGTFDFEVNWDDGSAPETFNGIVIANAGDTWDTPAHVYADDGDYGVAVQSTRQSDGKEAFAVIQVLVNNLAPTITVPAAAPTAVQLTEGTSPAPFTIVATDVAADEAADLALTIRGSIEEPTCTTCEVGCGSCGHVVVARTSSTSWTLTWDPVDWTDFYNTEFTIVVTDKDGGETTQDWTFNLTFTDSDNDDLPDGWENQEFGDTTQVATGDPDGDGITNEDEFLNGTDPTVSNAPTEPTLLAPIDRPIGELMPALVVANATDPDGDPLSYTFEVYGDEDLTTLVWDADGVTEGASTTSVDIDIELTDGTTYWWRARAADAISSGPWAEAVWFTVSVDNNAPGTPLLVAPAEGALVEVANPYFEVTPVEDIDGDPVTYSFEVYSDSGLTTLVASASGRVLPTWFADPALANGDYWWFVEATDGMMTSQSSVGTFSVELPQANLPPGAPTIASPTAGATVTTATPDLVVTNATDPDGDTLTYFFEVADNLAFVDGAASSAINEGASVTTWSVPIALAEDTAYFWRARAFDGLEAGDWALGTFVVNATNDGPGVPTIIAPATGAVLADDPTQLVAGNAMDPEGDALTYTFELSDDANGATILATGSDVAEGDGTTAWTIAGVTFEKGTTYYWRVSANDGTTDGEFTAWSPFTLFEAEIDLVPDDGCGCRGTSSAGWLMAFFGVFALVARRRRR